MTRYREEGEKENSKCDFCEIPIWTRSGIYTSYHGKGHYWNDNSKKEPCSFDYMEGEKIGKCCKKCLDKLNNKTNPEKGDLVKFKLDNSEFSGIVQETGELTVEVFVCCEVLGNQKILLKKEDIFKVVKNNG